MLQSAVFLLVSIATSVLGSICGIGGGVIIKPTLDAFAWCSVSTVSFLSGCAVLSMSGYAVVRSRLRSEQKVDTRIGITLALGAALGGVGGSRLFALLTRGFDDPGRVGAVQAICLAILTLGTLLYTLCKNKIRVHRLKSRLLSILIGFALGVISSFLGIGGGPINLVVLFYFFGMETKPAASCSLYVILFSQIANLLTILISGNLPPFTWHALAAVIAGGVGGGIIGRRINRKIAAKTVEKLFICLMLIVILISLYNFFKLAS